MHFRTVFPLVLLAALFILSTLLLGCGVRENRSGLTYSDNSRQARSQSLDSIFNDLQGLSASGDANAQKLEMLKAAFERALLDLSKERFISRPPTDDASQVRNLAFRDDGDGTYSLVWSYRNVGDYDQDGEVAVPDITPIALNYLDSTLDEPPSDADMVIDGSGDNEIGIPDITPIAVNYLAICASYRIEGSDVMSDPFTTVGFVVFPETPAPPFFRTFTFDLGGAPVYQYYRVVPLDDADAPGIASNVVERVIGGGTAPDITAVSPLAAAPAANVQFVATFTGDLPMTFAWSFGGGATPDSSVEESPTVTMGAEANYNCSVTATNAAGSDTFDFVLNVTASGNAPIINSVTPTGGAEGADITLVANVSGDAPFTYAWDFGAGATPSTSVAESPTVTLGAAGTYPASLTVTNGFGSDTYNFDMDVTSGGEPPIVNSVVPTGGMEGSAVTFTANLTGTLPITYAWDFGGGATPNTGTDAAPQVTLGVAGDYNANVTATNSLGNDSFDFLLRIVPPGQEWSIYEVAPDGGGEYASLAVIDGKPCIAYYDGGSLDLMFASNSAADGSGTWNIYTVDSKGMGMGDVGQSCALADVRGVPGISYYEGGIDFNLKYAQCSTADGSGAWNSYVVDSAGNVGWDTSLALVGGHIAISYYDADNMDLKYARANTPDPSGTYTIVTVDSAGDAGWITTLLFAGGKPIISYFADNVTLDFKLAVANDANGTGTWTPSTIQTVGSAMFAYGHSMALVGTTPAVSFYNWSDSMLRYGVNGAADGSGTWMFNDVDSQSNISLFIGMGAVGGLPAIAFRDFDASGLWAAICDTADGGGTWTASNVEPSIAAWYASVAEVSGRVGIAYYDSGANTLKFAIRNF